MIRAHAKALVTMIKATDAELDFYDSDEVPPTPLYPYGVLYLSRRSGGYDHRLNEYPGTAGFRAAILYLGRTADEARFVEERVQSALEYERVPVAGFLTTPCQFESSRGVTREPEVDNLYSGTSVWTFVSTQQVAA